MEEQTEIVFHDTPSTLSLENGLRMAQVQQRLGKEQEALEAYLQVVERTQQIVRMNPGSDIELQWALQSLREIAEIYYKRKDFNKSSLFHTALQTLIEVIKCGNSEDLEAIATRGVLMRKVIDSIDAAVKEPEKKPDLTGEDLLRQFKAAEEEDQQRELQRITELLEAHNREQEEKSRTCSGRVLNFIADHPVIVGLLFALIGLTLILSAFKVGNSVSSPQGEIPEVNVQKIEKLLEETKEL